MMCLATGGEKAAAGLDHADVSGWGVLGEGPRTLRINSMDSECSVDVPDLNSVSNHSDSNAGSGRSLLEDPPTPPKPLTDNEARAAEILGEVEALTRTFITAKAPVAEAAEGIGTPARETQGGEHGTETQGGSHGTQPHMLRRKSHRRRSCTYNCLNVDLSFDIRCLAEAVGAAPPVEPSFSVIRVDHSASSPSTGRVVRVVINNVPAGSPLHDRLLALHDRLVERIRAIDEEGVAVQKEVCWMLHQRKRAARTLTERMTFEILYMFVEDAAA